MSLRGRTFAITGLICLAFIVLPAQARTGSFDDAQIRTGSDDLSNDVAERGRGDAAYAHGKRKPHGSDAESIPVAPSRGGPVSDGQRQISEALKAHRGVFFAEARNVRVVRLLPDDAQGLKHQKWVVALDDGAELTAIYNLDICDRVPFRIGDTMTIGGQFIFDNGGGLLHWLHDDPRHQRPNGYVEVNGRRYGAITHPDR